MSLSRRLSVCAGLYRPIAALHRGPAGTPMMNSYEMADIAETAVLPVAARYCPSPRPLDHRWDASRGLSFSADSSVRKDLLWSPAQGIVFANTANSKRRYATRPPPPPSRYQPTAAPASPAAPKPGSLTADSWRSPSLVSPIAGAGHVPLPPKFRREKEELVTKLNRTSQELEAAEEAAAASTDRARGLERDLAQAAKELAASQQSARHLRQMADDLQKKLNTQKPAIWERARKDAMQNATHQVAAQLAFLRESESELRSLSNDKAAAVLRMEAELRSESNEINELKSQLSRRRLEEKREAEERREARLSYQEYRKIFDDLTRSLRALHRYTTDAESGSVDWQTAWQKAATAFDGWCTSQSATWWPHKYGGLEKSIKSFLEDSRQDAKAQADNLQGKHDIVTTATTEFRAAAHTSRQLTRHLRMEDDSSEAKTELIVKSVVHTQLRTLQEMVENAQKELDRTQPPAGDGGARRTLERQKHLFNTRMAQLRAVRNMVWCWVRMQHLESMLSAPLEQKESFVVTAPFLDDISWAGSQWSAVYRRVGKVSLERWLRVQETDRTSRDDVQAYGQLAYRRAAMERQLGIAKNREKEIDNRIGEEMKEQNRKLFGHLDLLQKLGHTSQTTGRRLTPPSRSPGPVLRYTSIKPVARAARLLKPPTKSADTQAVRTKTNLDENLANVRRKREKLLSADGVDHHAMTTMDSNIRGIERRLAALQKPSEEVAKGGGVDANPESSTSFGQRRRRRMRARRARKSTFHPVLQPIISARPLIQPSSAMKAPYANTMCQMDVVESSELDAVSRSGMDAANGTSSAVSQPNGQSGDNTKDGNASSLPAASSGSSGDNSSGQEDAGYINHGSDSEMLSSSDESFETISNTSEESTTASEEPTELTYQIPPQDFRHALMASQSSAGRFWKYTLYKSATGARPRCHYCQTFENSERAVQHFIGQPVLGFDIEWEIGATNKNSGIKRNVSLIQIACEDRVALFQLASYKGSTPEELMPPTLKSILEDVNVTKAGVNIAGDFNRLRKCLGIEGRGIFELSHLYKLVRFSEAQPEQVNRVACKLSTQVEDVLRLPLFKGEVRTSAWSKTLSNDQIEYAASDAYAGFRLWHALEAMRWEMKPRPPRPAFWEENKPIVLGDGTLATTQARAVAKSKEARAGADVSDEEDEEFFDAAEEFEELKLDDSVEAGASDNNTNNSEKLLYPPLPSDDAPTQSAPAEEPADSPRSVEAAKDEQISEMSKPATRTSKSPIPPSAEIDQAEAWVAQYQSSIPADRKCKAKPAGLRTYHLWHVQGLDLNTVASLLRQPPLALTTVASYVLEAIKQENLSFTLERVREPLKLLPTSVHGKYRGVLDRLAAAGLDLS